MLYVSKVETLVNVLMYFARR